MHAATLTPHAWKRYNIFEKSDHKAKPTATVLCRIAVNAPCAKTDSLKCARLCSLYKRTLRGTISWPCEDGSVLFGHGYHKKQRSAPVTEKANDSWEYGGGGTTPLPPSLRCLRCHSAARTRRGVVCRSTTFSVAYKHTASSPGFPPFWCLRRHQCSTYIANPSSTCLCAIQKSLTYRLTDIGGCDTEEKALAVGYPVISV